MCACQCRGVCGAGAVGLSHATPAGSPAWGLPWWALPSESVARVCEQRAQRGGTRLLGPEMDTVVEMNGFRGQVGAPPRCCPAPGTCRGAACAGGTGLWSRRCAGEQLCPSVRPSWAEWSVAAWERAALSARRLGFARSFRPWRRVCSLGAAASACGAGGGATAQSPAPLLPSPSLFRQARRMFEGELASLTAILKTGTVRVPKPIKVLDAPGGGSLLVMEHLDMRSLGRCVLAPPLLWLPPGEGDTCVWGCSCRM